MLLEILEIFLHQENILFVDWLLESKELYCFTPA